MLFVMLYMDVLIFNFFQVYNKCIIRFLEDPSDVLKLIRDEYRLVAYRLAKESVKVPLIVFTHQMMEE